MSEIFKPGETILNRFRIDQDLGASGAWHHWSAFDTSLEHEVRLLVTTNPAAADTMAARAADFIDRAHEGILSISDFRRTPEGAIAIGEWTGGNRLASSLEHRPGGCFGPEEIAPWAAQLSGALAYLHRLGETSGELDLEHVVVSKNGRAAKLDEFYEAETPAVFLSPERYAGGAPDPKSDVYAFGMLLYHLLTGGTPFKTGNLATQIANRAPATIAVQRSENGFTGPKIPPALESLVARCLEKDPDERPTAKGIAAHPWLGDTRTSAGTRRTNRTNRPAQAPPRPVNVATVKEVATTTASSMLTGRLRWAPWTAAGLLLLWASFYYLTVKRPRDAGMAFMREQWASVSTTLASADRTPAEKRIATTTFINTFTIRDVPHTDLDTALITQATEQRDFWQTQEAEEKVAAQALATTHSAMAEEIERIEALEEAYSNTGAEKILEAWDDFALEYAAHKNPESLEDEKWMRKATRRSAYWEAKLEAEQKRVSTWESKLDTAYTITVVALTNNNTPIPDRLASARAFTAKHSDPPGANISEDAIAQLAHVRALIEDLEEASAAQAAETALRIPAPANAIFTSSRLAHLAPTNQTQALAAIQASLKARGFFTGQVDGKTGQATHDALLAYKRSTSLTLDGKITDSLLDDLKPEISYLSPLEIEEIFDGSTYANHSLPGRKRHLGAAQEQLASLTDLTGKAFYEGKADMSPGPGTHTAITIYQSQNSITPTGQLTDETLARLNLENRPDDSTPFASPVAKKKPTYSSKKKNYSKRSRTRRPQPTPSVGSKFNKGFSKGIKGGVKNIKKIFRD